jgi:hypothetical protein
LLAPEARPLMARLSSTNQVCTVRFAVLALFGTASTSYYFPIQKELTRITSIQHGQSQIRSHCFMITSREV